MANSTNQTWLSSTEADDHDEQYRVGSSNSMVGRSETPTSTVSTLDRRLKGRKLDDSEVMVCSPNTFDHHAGDDHYEESKMQNVKSYFVFAVSNNFVFHSDFNISHISVIAVDEDGDRSSPTPANVSSVLVQSQSRSGKHIIKPPPCYPVYNLLVYSIPDDGPISIMVEGTTVGATDVDEITDAGPSEEESRDRKPIYVRDEVVIPVTKRNGVKSSKNRPVSDGNILNHQAYLHPNVRN